MALETYDNPGDVQCRFGDGLATHITPVSWGSEVLCLKHAQHHPAWESGAEHPVVPPHYRNPPR